MNLSSRHSFCLILMAPYVHTAISKLFILSHTMWQPAEQTELTLTEIIFNHTEFGFEKSLVIQRWIKQETEYSLDCKTLFSTHLSTNALRQEKQSLQAFVPPDKTSGRFQARNNWDGSHNTDTERVCVTITSVTGLRAGRLPFPSWGRMVSPKRPLYGCGSLVTWQHRAEDVSSFPTSSRRTSACPWVPEPSAPFCLNDLARTVQPRTLSKSNTIRLSSPRPMNI